MKKGIKLMALLFLLSSSFCFGQKKVKQSELKPTAKKLESVTSIQSTKTKADFPGDLNSFRDATLTITAASKVNRYFSSVIPTVTINALPGSVFQYNARELQAFIEGPGLRVIEYLHLFLAYDESDQPSANNKDSLHLVMCGVDKNGNHVFGFDIVQNSLFALEAHTSDKPKSSIVTTGARMLSPGNFKNTLSVKAADVMLKTYETSGPINNTAASFLFDANELRQYILSARQLSINIDHIDFCLGIDYGKLTMLIVGVDNAGNNILISTPGQACILEHCIPCPTCEKLTSPNSIDR